MVKNTNENLGAFRLTSNQMDIMAKEIIREKKTDLLTKEIKQPRKQETIDS